MSDTSTTLFLHGLENIHEITLLGVNSKILQQFYILVHDVETNYIIQTEQANKNIFTKLIKGFLDIYAEGFCIRADFLHEVRW